MSAEKRLKVGIPIIGCPDYLKLIHGRATKSNIPFSPPYIPTTLLEHVKKFDPAALLHSKPDLLNGKHILVLCGRKDELVPWTASEPFVEALDVGTDGTKQVFVDDNAGHELSQDMFAQMVSFLKKVL